MTKHPTLALLALLATLALPGAVSAQDEVTFERDPRPKLFVTDFTWYQPNERRNGKAHPSSLACSRAQPRRAFGEITATDYLSSDGYYAEKYRRFKSHGIDGIAFLMTDRVPDSFDGANLIQQADLAVTAGLDFFVYYDLFVNTAKTSNLLLCLPAAPCPVPAGKKRVPEYNINTRPQLYAQLREDFESIAQHLVLPHMDAAGPGYQMLEDATGERVLDEFGLPRPVIAITIAREFSDRPANLRRIGELMEETTEVFRTLGLGRPALVLDVIFWVTPRAEVFESPYDLDLLEAFADYAVAISLYGFFDPFRGGLKNITNDGRRPPLEVWAKYLHQHYAKTRDMLADDGQELAIWPAGQTQFDLRPVEVEGCLDQGIDFFYHLRSKEDWRAMLTRVLKNGWRPSSADGPALQTLALITNAGEWFETGGIDLTHRDRYGECSYPYNWCGELLQVIREEDLY